MENLITTISPDLRSFAYKLTYNKADADDLFQDTVFRMLKSIDKFQPGTNLKSWAMVIMRNCFINLHRKKKRRKTDLFSAIEGNVIDTIHHGTSTNHGEKVLHYQELMSMVEALPAPLSLPFLMVLEGFKYQEISDELDLPLGTLKSRIYVARKKLQQAYLLDSLEKS